MSKFYEGLYIDLFPKNTTIDNFNKNNYYKMTVKFNSLSGDIIAGINDKINFVINDKTLKGDKVGIISEGIGAEFSQILPERN